MCIRSGFEVIATSELRHWNLDRLTIGTLY